MSKTNRISHRRYPSTKHTPIFTPTEGINHLYQINTDKTAAYEEKLLTYKKILKDYARSRGYSINSGSYFAIQLFYKTISTKETAGIEEWIIAVLHELGHSELDELGEKNHIKTSLRRLNILLRLYKPTEVFYKSYYRMEWKAWERGFEIAIRLGININAEAYWKWARKYYQTYIDYLRRATYHEMMKDRNEATKKRIQRKKTQKLLRRRLYSSSSTTTNDGYDNEQDTFQFIKGVYYHD